jgi:Tol biopolymer transport system component
MSDRMTNPQGPIRSPGGPPGGAPQPGMAYGAAGTSTGRLPSGVRPPTASGTLRGRPSTVPAARYPTASGPIAQVPVTPRAQPRRGSPVIAPVLALIGLLAIGGASIWGISVLNISGAASEEPPDVLGAVLPGASLGPDAVADPSIPPEEVAEPTLAPIVTPPPDQQAQVRGTILFTRRDQSIYAASGKDIRKLTSGNLDSSPTWSSDGKHIYFIRTKVKTTNKTREKGKYTLYVPNVMRMDADGGKRKVIYDSLINGRGGVWFSHVLQPDLSPDGKTLAVVSDGPNGSGPVTLHTLSSKGGKLRKAGAKSFGDLGDNDPAWSPDGRMIAFTHNRRQGDNGAPALTIFNRRTGKTKSLRTGYAHPSWSPDGEWIAAELTTGNGRDIVILDAERGDERARLTTDGGSFAPIVSPDGNQVAYLHRDGIDIDLRLATLEVDEQGRISLVDDRAVIDDGSIDAGSSPSWFIPPDERLPMEADGADPDAVQADAPDGQTDTADGQSLGQTAP